MTLVEGIGDEVIHFFILLALVVVALVAWWSTNISERPLMRTVLILERRTTRHAPDGQTAMADLRDSNEMPSQANQLEAECKSPQSESDTTNSPIEVNVSDNFGNIIVNGEEVDSAMPNSEEVSRANAAESVEEECEKTCSVLSDAPVRRRTVGCLSSMNDSDSSQSNKCSPNLANESSTSGEVESNSSQEGNIRIRLKYLNDDQKLVEGRLQEQLGDFKRRHFNLELSGRKLVRLIFNGRVLQQDSKTLQNYGFFDNCVVHCLVHQPRTPPPSPNLNRPREGQTPNESPNHHWDLGNILFASLSFLLGLAWYGRYQYAQLYTATTTVALIGLTGMFTVSLIGMYMPDVDGIRT